MAAPTARAPATLRGLFPATAGLLALAACADGRGASVPDALPFVAQHVRDFSERSTFADLDGDGRDEILHLLPDRPVGVDVLRILGQGSEIVDQFNIVGDLLPPHVLDWDGDGEVEVFMPFTRNDSLHLTVGDVRGRKLFSFALTSGVPRVEPDGVLPWDPSVVLFTTADVDGRRGPELVTVVRTNLARSPRGVFVHTLPDGEALGALEFGAAVHQATELDLDGDGAKELLLASLATDNGANAGGLDDLHSYVLAVRVARTPALLWVHDAGGIRTRAYAHGGDVGGGGDTAAGVVAIGTGADSAWVRVLDPASGRTLRSRTAFPVLGAPAFADADSDGRLEVIIRDATGLLVIGAGLETETRLSDHWSGTGPVALGDVDGDARADLAFADHGGRRTVITDGEGVAKAIVPGLGAVRTMSEGWGVPRLIVVDADRGAAAYRLGRNRAYAWERWGKPAASPLATLALAGLLLALGSLWTGRRVDRAVEAVALSDPSEALLLLDTRGRVRWANPTARRWMPRNGAGVALAAHPELAAFCTSAVDAWTAAEAHGAVEIEGVVREARFRATPAHTGPNRVAHLWVRCRVAPSSVDFDDAETWAMFARRVAHDFKNPLGSVLMLLGNMRVAYRDQPAELVRTLDGFKDEIEDVTEELRRQSVNFLKFLDLRAPDTEVIDLHGFVRRAMIGISRSLPDDVELRVRCGGDEALVAIDREQMHSVLQNLVANANSAMRTPGSVGVTTSVVRRVRLEGDDAPTDYALIEVQDTGCGIPADERDRIFEPGYTTAPDGTGLGLAIVAKIVRDHGGHIAVESEVDVGSLFTVFLPLAPRADTAHRGVEA
jgi:nitrogen-specific signal transduction histidine kinase